MTTRPLPQTPTGSLSQTGRDGTNSVRKETSSKPTNESSISATNRKGDLMGEYRQVRGHHVHAKKAFEGDIKYDPRTGFCISEKLMKELNINHRDITTAQRSLFKELENSGRPNTLAEHTRIAVESLVKAGTSREVARSLVAKSLVNLKQQGVKSPTNIPWGGKTK